ncbi:pilus assembly protein [Sphingomonas sp. MMSM20]|uniref:TadE/TadG family type IV pilus assembly protein n=1 Tax=Sphingomonas lycopersici TaxID=2951807 RepID=UPI002237DC9E|nr:pilus assembly protein [Sphingomonas lycopersici]
MTRRRQALADDRRGTAIIEFAVAAPIFLMLAFIIIQLGLLFGAKAGLESSIDEGARYATIYPTPSDAAIIGRIQATQFLLGRATVTGPTITHGTNAGSAYIDIQASASVPLNFVLFQATPVTLNYTRRAYQH